MMDQRLFERRIREVAMSATSLKAPPAAWTQISERLQRGETVVLPVAEALQPRWNARAVKAAVLLLLVAGGAAAAISSKAVRNWTTELLRRAPAAPAVVEPAATTSDTSAMAATTLVIEPELDRIDVAFLQPARGARIRLRFADTRDLQLRAIGNASTATFRSALGRLTISNAPADGELLLTIPTRTKRVEVQVNNRAYLIQNAGELRILAPTADTVGSEIVLPITPQQ
jgi:hypothetical protein